MYLNTHVYYVLHPTICFVTYTLYYHIQERYYATFYIILFVVRLQHRAECIRYTEKSTLLHVQCKHGTLNTRMHVFLIFHQNKYTYPCSIFCLFDYSILLTVLTRKGTLPRRACSLDGTYAYRTFVLYVHMREQHVSGRLLN